MDIFASDILALQILRTARRGEGIKLVETDVTRVGSLRDGMSKGEWTKISRIAIPSVSCLERFDRSHPAHILVPCAAERPSSSAVIPTVFSGVLPRGTFSEVVPLSPCKAKEVHRILVPPPEVIVLQMSAGLQRFVRRGGVTQALAIVRLAELVDELCGTYSRDPMNPRTGRVAFRLRPALSPEELLSNLDEYAHMDGLPLLAKALRWTADGSSSPMETLLQLMFSLPARYGGLALELPRMNQPLRFDRHQRSLVSHEMLRPDVGWEKWRTYLEYNGAEWHDVPDVRLKDTYRIQDYQVCGLTVFPVVFENVRTAPAFNELAAKVCDAHERNGRAGTLSRFKRTVRDEGFLARQQANLMWLLPPVQRFGNDV